MRHVYLAATGQNRGKTTVSLGVMDGFGRRGVSIGFCKPVGQRTVIQDGVPADEDAVLMKTVFGLPGMSRFLFDAINQRDYPVIQGVNLVVVSVIVLVNLGVDTLYAVLDPRIRVAA